MFYFRFEKQLQRSVVYFTVLSTLRMKALIPELLGLLTATNFGGITLL
jgi:hypothetical protein